MSGYTCCASASDPELIRACLDGESSAWAELLERYGCLVYSIPRTYGLDPEQADTVFQDIFLSLYHHLNFLRHRPSVARWLIAVTLDRVGARVCLRDHPSQEGANVDHPPTPDEIQRWERQHHVRQAFRQLDPHCRETLKAVLLNSALASDQLADAVSCFREIEQILLALHVKLE